MTFEETLSQVRALLQSKQRVSYRALKRQFALDDDYVEDLKAELIDAERVAVDEDGKVLVWIGDRINREKDKRGKGEDGLTSSVQNLESGEQRRIVIGQTLDPRHQTLDAAERRQLTVMFCDLVDSTALSAQLDPEELREVVRAYQETCTAVVRRYDGHIAQHLGDGLLVYFGYPGAHEDDAARAVRTGLEIIEALRKQVPSPLVGEGQGEGFVCATGRLPLQVRIGIHTGLVVIGEIGSSEKREILAMGETPNIASRMQGTANPDEVIISAATYRLVEGLFECEDRGHPELRGVATPLTLYRAVSESEAHSRFEVVVRKGLTPLVGREHEYGLLCERWERVKDGAGQVVLLSGEPGIGKSRLVEALKETVEHEGARCLELRCSPYEQNSAFAPVIDHLQRTLQFRLEDTTDEKLRKLIGGATGQLPLQTEAIPLLAALLSLPHPTDYPRLTLSPQKQKEKTQEVLVVWLCSEAKQQVVTYAWEDLHWADPSTLELLTLFLAQVPTTRLLAMLTFRPEFIPPWGSHSYLSQLTLSRLGQPHVEVMVEKVTGGKVLPREIVRQIANKTDGVPLFVEELTKMVVESDLVTEVNGHYELTGPLPPLAIPSTLQDSLMARLDRLATVREIAQIGATLGREFSYELLAAVSPLFEDTLQQGLKQLVEAELVYQSGIPPQARYLFKHALVQDTAYQSLLKSRRQQLHHQVAQVLVEQFPQTVETQPELVAHHYTEARLIAQAIPYWQQAGQRTIQRSANEEAVTHLTTGLELLKTLPDTPERVQQELALQIALGEPLMAVKGYAAPEVEKTYNRALTLCRQVGESPQLFPVLWGLWGFHHIRGELQTARELAEQFLRLTQSVQDSVLLLEAHYILGETLYFLGELVPARVHLEQEIVLSDSQKHYHVQDPGIARLFDAALVLWQLGYPEQALKKGHKALSLARELGHPFTLALALHFSAGLHLCVRDAQMLQEQAEALIALSTEQGFSYRAAWGIMLRGWALSEQGQGEEGIAQIRQGLATLRTIGAGIRLPGNLALLAAACAKVGRVEEGLALVEEAMVQAEKTGERVDETVLYVLKGWLLLACSGENHAESEACFRQAIEIARRQNAKSWELRAVTSLSRLWQQQGKKAQARKLLAETYSWFTEGFDTKDLQEAKALLEELTG